MALQPTPVQAVPTGVWRSVTISSCARLGLSATARLGSPQQEKNVDGGSRASPLSLCSMRRSRAIRSRSKRRGATVAHAQISSIFHPSDLSKTSEVAFAHALKIALATHSV